MFRLTSVALALFALTIPGGAAELKTQDLSVGVPADVYLAVHARQNPERAFQRVYFERIWAAIEDTRFPERVAKLVSSRVPQDDLERAKSFFDEVATAAAPVDFRALWDCQEAVYAQTILDHTSQHLLLLRLPPQTAAAYEKGVVNLFHVVAQRAQSNVRVNVDAESATHVTSLVLPEGVPFRPTVAAHGDIFVFSSSEAFARRSLAAFRGEGGESKFVDPRLKEALAKLPPAEDSVVFYDARQQFKLIRGLLNEVNEQAGSNPEAERWLQIANELLDELSALDYIVTVEFTQENLIFTSTLGKFMPGADNLLLGKVLGGGEPFEAWHRWVPADAVGYSLSTGVNLHALYEFVTNFLHDRIPEARGALSKFEDWQDRNELHIDRDILQSFSGECVCVSLPSEVPSLLSSTDSVVALRCHNADKVRELVHRLIGFLNHFTVVKTQGLSLTPVDELEGFEELSAGVFALFGAEPVVGFRDGWMICGSNVGAVQKVLDTQTGKTPSILTSDQFRRFGLSVEGPVQAINETNIALAIRKVASVMKQAGAILPIVISVGGANVDEQHLRPWQDIVGLLPSLGEIIGKFDFMEASLSVTQQGPEPDTFLKRTVIYVRPLEETVPAESE